MTKENKGLDPKAKKAVIEAKIDAEKIAKRDEREAEKADATTYFKIKLKKVPEIADEKGFGDKIPLEENLVKRRRIPMVLLQTMSMSGKSVNWILVLPAMLAKRNRENRKISIKIINYCNNIRKGVMMDYSGIF